MSNKLAPNSQLTLDWVYGYRGHQCHNNLFYTNSEKIVYFVAGIGIVYDIKQRKQFYYFEHNDDIISLALASDGELVATGQVGKSPFICIWNSNSLETKSILKDQHTHGISSVAFSKNGMYLLSVGLDPNATLNVWDWKKGKVLSSTRAHSDRVFDARFMVSDGPIKFVTCGIKHIKFWSLCGNTLSSKKGIYGKKGEIQTILTVCMSISDNAVCYSGTLNGDVYIWRENNLERVIATVHSGALYSIESCASGYVTGGKDSCVVLHDPEFQPMTRIDLKLTNIGYPNLIVRSVHWLSNNVLVGTQGSDIFEILVSTPNKPKSLMMGHAAGELWALGVHPKKSIFATGSDDCSLRIWQMNEREPLTTLRIDKKIRSCGFNHDGSLIAIGIMDGSFSVIRTRDMIEVHNAQDRKEVLHELKFSPDGHWLAVGSNDNFVDIYDATASFKRTGVCKGNSSFITHLDWSLDSTYIRTNSGAAELLIFKAPGGEHITQTQLLTSIKWAMFTGVLGTDIQGIWAKYTDTNDINAADVNLNANLIATGDDFGLVKLFNYPSPTKGAHFRKYTGHSAHVTNVRWSFDKKFLISIGGGDQSIFQWRLTDAISGSGDINRQVDSFTDGSDSGLSDIGACNSELEKEAQTNYTRLVSKDEVNQLQKVTKSDIEDGKKRKKAPSQGLQLEWVHGYRGYDCRNNIFYLQSGEIVFHVAAVGIVMNIASKTQRFYASHNDDILCLGLHPLKDLIATGEVGREPTIHVWDTQTMKSVSILKGEHERGVCAVDFSSDGKKLASVGLDDNHLLVVWDWRKGEKLASTRAHKDKIFMIKWDPHNNNQLVAVGMKFIRFWTQVGGGFTTKRGTFGNVAKLDTQLCAAYNPNKPGVCYTGSPSGLVYIWKDNILQSAVMMHEGGCYAIDALDKGFVTGGKDGTIKLCDETFTKVHKSYKLSPENLQPPQMLSSACPTIRSVVLGKGKILASTSSGEIMELSTDGTINILVQGHGEGELWGLAVHPSKNICATVSDDCYLMIWEVEPSNHKLIKLKKLKGPARCCDISCDGSAVAVGFKDGSFLVLSLTSLGEIASSHHRKEEISDIKFSPAPGKYLAVGSHDNFVDIYSAISHQRLSVCKGCSSYITHLDWSTDGKLLMVNSGAKEQLFFEAPRGTRQIIAKTEIEKIIWASWSCVLGDSCIGIWPPKCDITDVNSVSLTSDGKVLATGDDFGRVKLFEYPSKTKFAKFKQYLGHSAHVTNVRWLHNDEYLLSVGGADTALMVWKHRRDPVPLEDSINNKKINMPQSDLSDTDSEEENGFDSDVEREKSMDYIAKTYSERLNQQQTESLKPDLVSQTTSNNNLKASVSRETNTFVKVQSAALLLKDSTEIGRRSRSNGKTTPRRLISDPPNPVIEKVTQLELKHVHGYRGFDCRNNLHYLDAEGSSIVYHAAAVGIVHNLQSGQQSFFLEHNDDILCLTVNRHPKYRNVVATGQIGAIPSIHVWNSLDCTKLSTLKGVHINGICSLDFSSTGTLLLSVGIDNDHTIAVWKWETGTLLAKANGHTQRIFLAEFRPDSDSIFVNVGVKHVKFWTLAGSELIAKRGRIPSDFVNQPRMTTMLSVAFCTNDTTYTGAMNGSVWVWKSGVLTRIVEKAHSGPVFVLFTTLVDGLIVSGGKEKGKDTGSIKLWDQEMIRNKPFYLAEDINVRGSSETAKPLEDKSMEVIRSISRVKGKILLGTQDNDILEILEKQGTVKYLMQAHGEGVLCGLAVHPFLPQYSSASEDGTVRIWDLETKMLIQSLTTGPATCVDYSPNGNYLVIGLKSGAFVVLSAQSYRLLIRKKDRGKQITDIKFSPNSSLIAVGSNDNVVDIYKLDSTGGITSPSPCQSPNSVVTLSRPTYCKDLGSPAVQIDFSTDGNFIRCGLKDYKVKIYSTSTGQIVNEPEKIEKIIWISWSSVVGEEVAGIWPDKSDKADVNTAVVSHQSNAFVTGDDYGLVKLYSSFPVPRINNSAMLPNGVFRGHSSNVTNVRFVNDDSHLVSTGGEDCCVFVWKCS